MPWMYGCVLLAVLCLSSVDLSVGQWNSNSNTNTGAWAYQPSNNRVKDRTEIEGSGRLPFSDDEDFGVSGSGSGSGFEPVDVDIIIDGDEVTTTSKRPMLASSTTTTTTTRRPLTECEKMRRASQQLVGQYVPRCLENGDFDSLQCSGNPATGDCWCSDLDGREIPGSRMEAPNFPECEEGSNLSPCVHQLVKHIRGQMMGSFRPRCTVDGQFDRMQCFVNMCFCVDESTGERKRGTELHTPEKPNCDEDYVEPSYVDATTIRLEPEHKEGNEEGIDIDEVVYPNPDATLGEGKDEESLDLDVNIENSQEDNEYVEEEEEEPMEETNETGVGSDAEVAKKKHNKVEEASEIMTQPGILAGIIAGSVVFLLCLVLLVMFIVYRMRKKDEGSYPLDEPNRRTPNYSYVRAPEKEFYA